MEVYMKVLITAREVEIQEQVDVLVVGGGPAGIGAAVSAARTGGKVLLLERKAFLGGNITSAYVESCNWFMNNTHFSACGLYREIEDGYRAEYGRGHEIREYAPFRFNGEYLKIFLDELMNRENVKVLFYSFVNDVVVENNHIKAVIIQTKNGPAAVSASVVIDATGDGDVAYAAGVPFKQGRDKDGYCQPGTLNLRLAGVNPKFFAEGPAEKDRLKAIDKKFQADYDAGKIPLDCKRRELIMGRLTSAGVIGSLNYPCSYMIDPVSFIDLSKGEMECRQYIKQIIYWMKENLDGFEGLELVSIAPELGFRDSRRIEGKYTLTMEDIENNKSFDDTVCVFPRFYDMLAPDGNMTGNGALEGQGYKGHVLVLIEQDSRRSYNIPYRTLIPVIIDNLLVSGRCISTTHTAESSIRAIHACMLTGQAAGTAAALSVKDNCTPEKINIRRLQDHLVKQGISIPKSSKA
jgi:hypothetical protein